MALPRVWRQDGTRSSPHPTQRTIWRRHRRKSNHSLLELSPESPSMTNVRVSGQCPQIAHHGRTESGLKTSPVCSLSILVDQRFRGRDSPGLAFRQTLFACRVNCFLNDCQRSPLHLAVDPAYIFADHAEKKG